MKKTPLKDQDNKIDIIEHINQDHTDEVLIIAQVYADSPDAVDAKLHDVFDEGIEIRVYFAGGDEKIVYAAFQMCTPNMLRLTVSSEPRLPENAPAYAFEQDSAKTVRMHLRKTLQISGQDNRIKGYWALKTKEQ